jgi:hypothetical protein
MKLLDARREVIDDKQSLGKIRKALGRDHNALNIAKLRSTPEASLLVKRQRNLAKRHNGENYISSLPNPTTSAGQTLHAKLRDMDESSGKFKATLDQSTGLRNYKSVKASFNKSLPAHFHSPAPDKLRRGRPVGDLDMSFDDSKQQIHLHGQCHDMDEQKKINAGLYSHLAVDHDQSGTPVHVRLTDSAHSPAATHLKLAKRDGSVSMVKIRAGGGNAVSPLNKREELDPFKRCLSRPAGSFGR